MNRLLACSLLLAAASGWLPGSVPRDTLTRVDGLFAEFDRSNSPGCALGVIRDGRFVYRRGYGMANLEWGIAIGSDTVFRIGSTSKQFTAAAVALLAKQGKLSLDDELQKFFPEIPRYSNPITIRHLVHHTSGLRDYLTLASLSGLRDDDYYTDAEALEMLARQKDTNFPAGEQYLYSNSNYLLLAHLVQRASGRTLSEFAREEIFEPLGMENTHFHDDHKHVVARRAAGYRRLDEGGFEISMTTLDMVGDGGLLTTVDDLLAWDRSFTDDPLSIVPTMLTRGTLNGGEQISYAFGLGAGSYRGLPTVRHGGAFVGFRAGILRFPEQRFSVICLCNVAQSRPSTLANQVAEVFLGELMEPEAEPAPDAAAETGAEAEPFDPALLDDYPGSYRVEPELLLEITREGDRLFGTPDDGDRRELHPAGRDRFEVPSLSATLTFERSEAGDVSGLVIDFGSRRTTAPRVSDRPLAGDELAPYAGTYFNEELNANYLFSLEEGKLRVRVGRRLPEDVVVRESGHGGCELGTIRFDRSGNGQVAGFVLQAGRVRNLRFVRR